MKEKKRRIKTGPIIVLFMIFIFGILIFCILELIGSLKTDAPEEIKIVNQIETYQYNLDENDSAYVSDVFKELKEELEKETKDEEKYASLLSQIFLADFFTLNSATSKNDVGGTQFVLSTYKDTFVKKAKDTVYRYVENNMYKNRQQELPIVSKVDVKKIEKKAYITDKLTDANAYYVTCEIHYKEELDYQTYANLILVHNENKLEVAVMK